MRGRRRARFVTQLMNYLGGSFWANSLAYSSAAPAEGKAPKESMCAWSCARMVGFARSATSLGDIRRWLMKSCCLNSQTMSNAVGIPAAAEAPAPRNHMRLAAHFEDD